MASTQMKCNNNDNDLVELNAFCNRLNNNLKIENANSTRDYEEAIAESWEIFSKLNSITDGATISTALKNTEYIEKMINEIEIVWVRSFKDHNVSRQYLLNSIWGHNNRDLARHFELIFKLNVNFISNNMNSNKILHILNIAIEALDTNPNSTEFLPVELHTLLKKNGSNLVCLEFITLLLKNDKILKKLKFQDVEFLVPILAKNFVDLSNISITTSSSTLYFQEIYKNKGNAFIIMIFSELKRLDEHRLELKFIDYINSLIVEVEEQIDNGGKSFDIILTCLIDLYPIMTRICSSIFLSSNFQKILIASATNTANNNNIKNIFKLLSVACIDESVRVFIAENYLDVLIKCLQIANLKLFCAAVLVKIWNFTKLVNEHNVNLTDLTQIFIEEILSYDMDHQDVVIVGTTSFYPELKKTESVINQKVTAEKQELSLAIESLSYLSLKKQVGHIIRQNGDLCLKFFDIFRNDDYSSETYGLLSIICNSIEPPTDNEKEHKDLGNLVGTLAAKGEESSMDTEETNENIHDFVEDYILDLGVINYIIAHFSKFSLGSKELIGKLFYYVCKHDREFISDLDKTGDILISIIREKIAVAGSSSLRSVIANDPPSLRALRLILMFNDPAKVFYNHEKDILEATVLFMESLPSPDSDNDQGIKTYENLIALSNLASTSNKKLVKIITSNGNTTKYWDKIENLLIDSNHMIQRSALELVVNIMATDIESTAKFFNYDNPKSLKNYKLLVDFFQLKDVKSQEAVASIFCNVAHIPFISSYFIHDKKLISNLLCILKEQRKDEELVYRVLFLIKTLLEEHLVSDNEETFVGITDNLQNKLAFKKLVESYKKKSNSSNGDAIVQECNDILKYI
ncbi:She4p SCDLUD_004710 [Saccharomycodes ludwigii]|uniref:She4p n=1 Tax=Saccharomycodes ludwigii TaxID=36035 RepID=UPI001E896041|nr:hypothetical protein SCDLUD_004710 [Saccharomycodes ludwigii]KAH3899274.1 hypothetical protein SCDLUD_004710 [Saccharomycodes ludwigii]